MLVQLVVGGVHLVKNQTRLKSEDSLTYKSTIKNPKGKLYDHLPFLLHRMTIQTVAIAIAMTAQPTVTVVKIATKGTSESPEFDHLDPERISIVTNILAI